MKYYVSISHWGMFEITAEQFDSFNPMMIDNQWLIKECRKRGEGFLHLIIK